MMPRQFFLVDEKIVAKIDELGFDIEAKDVACRSSVVEESAYVRAKAATYIEELLAQFDASENFAVGRVPYQGEV